MRERTQEAEDLKERPERVVLEAAKLLVRGGLHLMVKTSLGKLRRGLDALERRGRNTRSVIARLSLEVRSWGEYREDLKSQMIALLEREAQAARERASRRDPPSRPGARDPPRVPDP